jgi:Fic-DOC domain mobile mystery protein B
VKFVYPSGATPIDPNEIKGLIPDYITTQSELNFLEQENILEAVNWLSKKKDSSILTASFVLELHKRMFGRVWKWAGTIRQSDKNIGVPKSQISNQLKIILDDVSYWIKEKTFSWDEIGVRFHHRLVFIHIFSNGNGRHARLLADVFLEQHNQKAFTWGMKTTNHSLDVEGEIREKYIQALKDADKGDFTKLIAFVRS